MLFNSIEYLVFLPIVFISFWFLKRKGIKHQNFLLLSASYIFYGWWDWRFLFLIISSTLIDFFVARNINNSLSAITRKKLLFLSIIFNLGMLGFFKYYNFFIDNWVKVFGLQNADNFYLNIILPVGISFYTFQTLSYTIDVYNNKLKPTRSLLDFALFVSLFPQLVAGPIERAKNLLPQIKSKKSLSYQNLKEGLLQLSVGLTKKLIIADTISLYVDSIYSNYQFNNSITLLFATYLYAIQIYCDFSGYSDIAIGTAKLFNLSFLNNFNRPYLAVSITDFWRRWHISLSSWLKDYLYIPIGGNRNGNFLTYRNLMITMALGGLWHGSSWNFIIWGIIHGFFLAAEKLLKKINMVKSFRYIFFRRFIIFNMVSLAWIFFRSASYEQALNIIITILRFDISHGLFIGNINVMSHILVGIVLFIVFTKYFDKVKAYEKICNSLTDFRLKTLIIFFIFLIILLHQGNGSAFIYFQF